MSSSTSSLEERHRQLGLTDDEYARILERLGRAPGDVELAMLSLMWSEHCGYKHSRRLLRRLPKEGSHVLMGPGENAGAVDVGGGLAVAFKVESHNHPSAVEPFQGAATGVGGILRDVFAVGARPIAVLDSLRFGEPAVSERSRYLLDRAVAGIGHYGNSIGVPTVGGEIYFEDSYSGYWNLGALLTAGVDVWINTPRRPYEASGTSGMKAALNGVPSLSILDGWWIEGCIEGFTGWAIEDGANDAEEANSLYHKLESAVVPLFLEAPERWARLMRNTVSINGSYFNTNRMVRQYTRNSYYPVKLIERAKPRS